MSGKIACYVFITTEEGIETRKRFVIPDINRGIAEELREREREGSAGKTGVTGPAREKPSKIKFFSFLAAKPFSPSFFPRLPATDSTFCTQNLMARGKDKDLSL